MALALVGWLTTQAFVILIAATFLASVRRPTRRIKSIAVSPVPLDSPSDDNSGILDRSVDLSLALALLGTLAVALLPVTDGDALCYHLQVPKLFLEQTRATYDPDLHETVYPLVTEMLYAMALAFRGPVACLLVHWLLGLTLALNVTAVARPVLGRRARWAGAVALLVPAVSNGMSAPLNDVALAAFGTASLHAWMRWCELRRLRWLILAGALVGFACGVKYPALVWLGVLGLATAATSFVINRGSFIASLRRAGPTTCSFLLAALLTGAGWYLRTYFLTGNPVFPFFRTVFGAGIDEVLDPAVKRPLAATLPNLATALAAMTLEPDRFDSVSHQFGPMFLLFLPAIFLIRAPRRVWLLAGLAFAFLTLCLTQRQSMRFVLLAVGPLAVAVAWAVNCWCTRPGLPARALGLVFGAVVVAQASLCLVRARHGVDLFLGRESAESYLARREPTFTIGRWIDQHLPAHARLIGQDHRGYYLPRSYTMELAHRRRTGLGQQAESAFEIIDCLRTRGFTHLMLCPPEPETAVEFDPLLLQRLKPWLDSRIPLLDQRLADADGVVRHYRIFRLEDPPPDSCLPSPSASPLARLGETSIK
jgi:hypothetical protein